VGVGAGLYMYDVVVEKFTFAISSPDQFLFLVTALVNESWPRYPLDFRPFEQTAALYVICNQYTCVIFIHRKCRNNIKQLTKEKKGT